MLVAQLAVAECVSREYTGVGVYVRLRVDPSAPKLNSVGWTVEHMPMGNAEHPALAAGVGLILWIQDGYISCLECYTYDGNWPDDESLLQFATS